jgi:hypothetical protein
MASVAAIGLRLHSGWACAVAIAYDRAPRLVTRRRLVLCKLPHAKQPYHAAENMDLAEAENFIARCRAATLALAAQALARLRQDLSEQVFAGVGLAASQAKPLPGLAHILRSHALIHAAEGAFYRDALMEAAGKAGVQIATINSRAASGLLATARDLREALDEMGKDAGPPWTVDEKLASLAALSLLPGAKRRFHLKELEDGV